LKALPCSPSPCPSLHLPVTLFPSAMQMQVQQQEGVPIEATVPTVAASQLHMEGQIAELVAGQQAATQTLVEVDKELEWLVASLGQQEPRHDIQASIQRLMEQVQGLEGRGGQTPLEPGQDQEFGTVAALQFRLEDDCIQLSAMQRCLAEAVFEVYQEIARLNIRLGKQDGQVEGLQIIQEGAQVFQGGVMVQQGAPQLVYQAPPAPSTVTLVQGQPQVATSSMAWPPATPTMSMSSPPTSNLPTYGPPTTIVAPAQYMMMSAQPTTITQPTTYTGFEQAVATQSAFTAPAPVASEPMQAYSAPPVTAYSAPPVTAYSAPPVVTHFPPMVSQAAPVMTQSAVMTQAAPVPVATTPALPALAPTTVVAAAQYMMPGSSAASAVIEQGLGGVTMSSLPQPVPTEPLQMTGGMTYAAPAVTGSMAMTMTAPAVTMGSAALPALASTTVVAPAQYMTGPMPSTTPIYPSGPVTMSSPMPMPVATQSVSAPMSSLGAFINMPGTGSIAVPGGIAATAFEPIAGALPIRGSLLKAGSITDDVFNMVDKDNDGVISRSEFRGALKGGVIGATANTKLQLQGHL